MNEHLKEISTQVQAGAHAALICDGAGWHQRGKTLDVPSLSERLTNCIQLSSEALAAYVSATEEALGTDVDYGPAVKFYEADPIGSGRYSPPKVVRSERTTIVGNPDQAYISTSLVERQN
jgi:hypothetical protein